MNSKEIKLSPDQADAYDAVTALLKYSGIDLDNDIILSSRRVENKVMALLGKAGSGKTLLLSKLYLSMTQANVEVIIGDYEPKKKRCRRAYKKNEQVAQ